ncbi:MAG: aminodeoxychorismate/anthranilate synthase component II [Desulfuromonadales bacterium]|nr:aminodeoxychorismate/anthranilate synthase component II [Desulfuromonadales bacterium]
MLLMIDNYDSFTYNLVQYFSELGVEVEVWRNDSISIAEIAARHPSHLVVSPGPCTPDDAGISIEAIQAFAGQIPIFGVCLGHQSIVQAFGGRIVRAKNLMHGKTSRMHHDESGLFHSMSNPFVATRYHSLLAERDSLPSCLKVTAWTDQAEIMAVAHSALPVWGVQFHPESILTIDGKQILRNFLNMSAATRRP